MFNNYTKEDGFTLIELLIVILIIGILLAIAAPAFLGQQNKAHDSQMKQELAHSYKALKASATSNSGAYPSSISSALSAVTSSEPELANVIQSTITPGQGQIGFCAVSPTGDVLWGQSKSGTYFTAVASDSSYSIDPVMTNAVSNVQSICLVLRARAAAEVYKQAHGGSYSGLSPSALNTIDSTINTDSSVYPYLGNAQSSAGTDYWLQAVTTHDYFDLNRDANGGLTYSCTGSGPSLSPLCVSAQWLWNPLP